MTQTETNARLIAAAPDMLAALKDLLADVEAFSRMAAGVVIEPVSDKVLRRAKEIIAKAEGR